MASRQIKMPAKDDSEKEVEEVFSQRKRPETGRYWLQVDRQTKGSYATSEAAQSAALAIKTGYPIVQVAVYDSVEYTHTMVEAPAAAGTPPAEPAKPANTNGAVNGAAPHGSPPEGGGTLAERIRALQAHASRDRQGGA